VAGGIAALAAIPTGTATNLEVVRTCAGASAVLPRVYTSTQFATATNLEVVWTCIGSLSGSDTRLHVHARS